MGNCKICGVGVRLSDAGKSLGRLVSNAWAEALLPGAANLRANYTYPALLIYPLTAYVVAFLFLAYYIFARPLTGIPTAYDKARRQFEAFCKSGHCPPCNPVPRSLLHGPHGRGRLSWPGNELVPYWLGLVPWLVITACGFCSGIWTATTGEHGLAAPAGSTTLGPTARAVGPSRIFLRARA